MFRFKRFEVRHGQGSMKVGVDAVLLGCWAGEKANEILDIGTGCGVIALILAQRFPEAKITAIDVDLPSVEESSENFLNSPWSARMKAQMAEFPGFVKEVRKKYDLVVSNPPYFSSGIINPISQREKARHQYSLSVFSLIENASEMLSEKGRLAIIFPTEYMESVKEKVLMAGLHIFKTCMVKNREGKNSKRVMMEFGICNEDNLVTKEENLILFEDEKPTKDYLNLCRDFYIKF